ncbi:hypothetical protein PACILC2_02190 [Paenibacillus cisolokensis]|uniref:Carbohydrate ABC transporter permease n=1 Tax=Paenibacillus cisolokensis TaxID=1658519 RepID=A0ABQ4N0X5_9BACL|nr:hypothetical protein [Paenibacillus cisolokensis]GIQ61651.1 hypothetical protein PACILC2_02190 [Paenibacillus cisolokensis]
MTSKAKINMIRYMILVIAIIVTIMPFLFIIATSLKDFISIMSNKILFSPTLDNYKELFFPGDRIIRNI